MKRAGWIQEFPGAITVVDSEGVILEMNARAVRAFQDQGGEKLIGTNVLDCHPEPARSKVKSLLDQGGSNVYTIEKNGIKKLIFQSPWFENGTFQGLVELSLEIPESMPHFIRDP